MWCKVCETYSFRGIISRCIPRPVIHNWNRLFASAQTSIFSQHVRARQELQFLGENGWGEGTENEIPKETRDEALHEKLSVPQFGLCSNLSKCPSNHSHAICDIKSRPLLFQSHLQMDLIKTLAAQIFPCLILHTETSNTFEDIIPKASMQASTDHTCCPPPYAPPLAPLHCPPSQSH